MHDLMDLGLKLKTRSQWRVGDTCIANLDGSAASAVTAYVLRVRERDRVLELMIGDGCKVSCYFEWCHSRKGK